DCATHFHASGLNALTIANRSAERASDLAERFEARAAALDELPELLAESDLIIACTGSPRAIIDRPMFREALRARRQQPMFALDLSVPRNISADSASLNDLYLYTIDDLRAIVESAQQQRQQALQEANAIVESEVATFERWLRLQGTSTTLRILRQRAQGERDQLLERAQRELQRGADPEAVMRKLSHRLVNRLLHGPS